jgi:hypothetical protein
VVGARKKELCLQCCTALFLPYGGKGPGFTLWARCTSKGVSQGLSFRYVPCKALLTIHKVMSIALHSVSGAVLHIRGLFLPYELHATLVVQPLLVLLHGGFRNWLFRNVLC